MQQHSNETGKGRGFLTISQPERANRFSSTNQPSREKKRKGQLIRSRGTDLVRALLAVKPDDPAYIGLRKEAADFFRVREKEITNEIMMHYKVLKRVLDNGDVVAYNALMDRGYGKPLIRVNEDWQPPETAKMVLPNGTTLTL